MAATMSPYFTTDADLTLMGQDEMLGQYFPPFSYQSPQAPLYSTSHSQSIPQQIPLDDRFGKMSYSQPQSYRPLAAPQYSHPSFWPSPPMSVDGQLPFPAHSSPRFAHSRGSSMDHSTPLSHSFDSRSSRSPSFASAAFTSAAGSVRSNLSRSTSPTSADLRAYGYLNKQGTWTCSYPGCTSRAVFTRGCDLRKHHKRHTKSFFCSHEGCPQATGGGFSSKKDLARHEAKHNPGVLCEWKGCDRVFSRVDNMVRLPQPVINEPH